MKVLKILLCVCVNIIILSGLISLTIPGNTNITSVILLVLFILLDIKLIKSIKNQKSTKFLETQEFKSKNEHTMKEGSSMKNICPICGNVIKTKTKIVNGIICAACTNLTPYYATETIDKLKQYHLENQKRKKLFNQTNMIKDFLGNSVFIDDNNHLFYIGSTKLQNPQYYYFSEISDYSIEKIGEKTITKSKGGIKRAVIGGALFGSVGAVVGASTSKKETKNIGGQDLLKITIKHPFGTFTKEIFSPPFGLTTFLDKCISQNSTPIFSETDELLKFKNLFDNGVITQEEFEIKKKQLLGL